MPTYRELYDKLATLSPQQLDSEIRIIPVGYTDADASAILNYATLPEVLEFSVTSRDLYHFAPSGDEDWCEPGICDFSKDEVDELGIDKDQDYVKICGRGTLILKVKDNIQLAPEEVSDIGNLDTSILHL